MFPIPSANSDELTVHVASVIGESRRVGAHADRMSAQARNTQDVREAVARVSGRPSDRR